MNLPVLCIRVTMLRLRTSTSTTRAISRLSSRQAVHIRPRLVTPARYANQRMLLRTRNTNIIVRANEFEFYTHLIGKGLILFVLFASTLNWLHYKTLREEIEKTQKDKDKK